MIRHLLNKGKEKFRQNNVVVYLLSPPKYFKKGFLKYTRKFFKILSKKLGLKWISTGWDYVEFKILKPYLVAEAKFLDYVTAPFIRFNIKDLVWSELVFEKKRKLFELIFEFVEPGLLYIRDFFKIFLWERLRKLNIIIQRHPGTDNWYVDFMLRERRAIGYPRKSRLSPFKVFLTVSFLWNVISELESEFFSRQDIYLFEWFYKLDFFLTLRLLKILSPIPRFFSAPLASQYYFTAASEARQIQSFLNSLVLKKKRNVVAEVVAKMYLYGSLKYMFQYFSLKIYIYYLNFINTVLVVLLDYLRLNPFYVRLALNLFIRFDYGFKELSMCGERPISLIKMFLFKVKDIFAWTNFEKWVENVLLKMLKEIEKFYRSDYFAPFRYYKYYKIITLGKNYFYRIFYKFFVIFFLITNVYLLFNLHPIPVEVLMSKYANHANHIARVFYLQIPYSMSFVDFSDEWMAMFLICYVWIRGYLVNLHAAFPFFLTWYFFLNLFFYFLPADKNPFISSMYIKTEHDIVEQLKGLLPESQKLNKNVFVDENFLSFNDSGHGDVIAKQLRHELVMEFTDEAKTAYELMWFESLVYNEEAIMQLFPSFYLTDYYSYACLPSPIGDEYPVTLGFDDEDAEYSLNWVLPEADTTPDDGYNVDIEADVTGENAYEESNVYDFPVEPMYWEFEDELDEDVIEFEEFFSLHYNMYSFFDYTLHEFNWDSCREDTVDNARDFSSKAVILRFYVSLPYQMSQLFDDPDVDDNRENHAFETLRVFKRDPRFTRRLIWLDTGTYNSELVGGDDPSKIKSLGFQRRSETSLALMYHNYNTYYMEKRPYGFNHYDWMSRDKYTSVDYASFIAGYTCDIEPIDHEEKKQLQMDGVVLDDETHDGRTDIFEDDDYADENAFVDLVPDDYYDGSIGYDESSTYGGLYPLEIGDSEDFQVMYGPAATSEWAREEFAVYKHLSSREQRGHSLLSMMTSRHTDEAEVLSYGKVKSRKMIDLAKLLAPLASNPDVGRTDFDAVPLNNSYDDVNYDYIDSVADIMYTSDNVFDTDGEEEDVTWPDIYDAFLGYVPDMLGKENFKVERQRTSSYGKTDSYILFGMDLETDLYDVGAYSYMILISALAVFAFKAFRLLHWSYIVFLIKKIKSGRVKRKKWAKRVRDWRRDPDGVVSDPRYMVEYVVNYGKPFFAMTRRITKGVGYSNVLITGIIFMGLAALLYDQIMRFYTFRWDLLESKNFIESGGQTNIYKYEKINKKLKNSRIYLFKPEENANFAFSSFYKNINFFRKFSSKAYSKNRVSPPRMYVMDSELSRSANSLATQSLEVIRKEPILGYAADLQSPDEALLTRYQNDPFHQLDLFSQHFKAYELEFAALNTFLQGAYDEYEPVDEFLEDIEDHWRINNKVLGAGGDSIEASRLYLNTQYFLNWVAMSWNITDLLIWRRTMGQGRYFSNYAFIGNKQNQVYDNEYETWIFATGFNIERTHLSEIRYYEENRKRLSYSDLKQTSIPNALRRLVKRKLIKHYRLSKKVLFKINRKGPLKRRVGVRNKKIKKVNV